MSYKQMERRLADLEEAARAQERARVASLSADELDAAIADFAERDPVGYAAVEAMSAGDLDRLCDGKMLEAEWEQHLARAQERINAA